MPIVLEHGAAIVALTIDEVGMAKTRDRKVEIASRIHEMVCDDHGLDPQLLIFDALTFTLTTGDDEWKPSAVETIEGIQAIKNELPGVLTSLGVSNVSFGVSPARARRAELGVPAPLRGGGARPRDGQPQPHHAVRRDLRGGAGARRRPRVQPPRGRARALHRALRDPRRVRRGRGRATRPPTWSPRTRCTGTSCAARRRAWRTRSTSRWRRSARSRRSTTSCCPP